MLLDRECCVCEVMQALKISQSRASRNLSILYEAGFLKLEKNGLWSIYSIDREGMPEYLLGLLQAVTKELASNEEFILDKKRLSKAERIGPQRASSLQ